jgi:hypothetical protein
MTKFRLYLRITGVFAGMVVVLGTLGGCVTVRPEQRAILADPTMRFDRGREDHARQHVLENREGAYGGGSVQGGGCGCN